MLPLARDAVRELVAIVAAELVIVGAIAAVAVLERGDPHATDI